ncbi:MAG: exodeoxyribonuclease V subunit alpha [Candidatus Anammoxibacter sp.]
MTNINPEKLKDLRIVPKGNVEPEHLYNAAIESDELSLQDYMTISDLTELSGHKADASLTAILICMFASLNEGSICMQINKPHLTKNLERFLDCNNAENYATKFLTTLAGDSFANIITTDKQAYIPIIREKSDNADILYFKKYHVHKDSLNKGIKSLLQIAPLSSNITKDHDSIIDDVINTRPVFLQKGIPAKLDPGQERAIRLALTTNFLIISGGPGTGKTTILVNIIRCLVRKNIQYKRILIAAPTGRAAQRITESVQRSLITIENPTADDIDLQAIAAKTIHRLLKYNSTKNSFMHQPGNTLPADVVIIDEVSMVDVSLMDDLLKAIDLTTTKIILLGDRNQLPSVDAGAVLADLIPDKIIAGSNMEGRIAILERDYRSKGAIRDVAKEINDKDRSKEIKWSAPVSIREALKTESGEYSIIAGVNRSDWTFVIKTWADHFYCKPDGSGASYIDIVNEVGGIDFDTLNNEEERNTLTEIFTFIQRSKILTIMREGVYGCAGVNNILSEYLSPKFDRYGKNNRFNGAPVMILRNNYDNGLFNGDVGVTFRDSNGIYHLIVQQYGKFYSYPLDSIPTHETAFAVTVHKSQGSEYDNVMIVLPEKGGESLLTREIIYTGLTRAKERAFIYGNRSVLNRAVSRKVERFSGLMIG